MASIEVSPELYEEWLFVEVDTWDGADDNDGRASFVRAHRDATRIAKGRYRLALDDDAVWYLGYVHGALGHTDIWEDQLAEESRQGSDGDPPVARKILAEAKRLRKKFPEHRQHSRVHRVARSRSPRAAFETSCPKPTGVITVTLEAAKRNRLLRREDDEDWSGEDQTFWDEIAGHARAALEPHGVRPERRLGCGSYACAYEVRGESNALVAKLTTDGTDAAAWQTVLDNAGEVWPAGLAETFCVTALPPVRGHRMYLILQERLEPVDAVEDAGAFLNDDEVRDALLAGDAGDMHRLALDYGAPVHWVRPLIYAVKWLGDHGVVWKDFHAGNVMVSKMGMPRIVDLGFGTIPDTKIRTIEKGKGRSSSSTEDLDESPAPRAMHFDWTAWKRNTVRVGNVELVYEVRPDYVNLLAVRTLQGTDGSQTQPAIEVFLAAADRKNARVRVGVPGRDARKRVPFYQLLGFELTGFAVNDADDPEMIRQPRKKPAASTRPTRNHHAV